MGSVAVVRRQQVPSLDIEKALWEEGADASCLSIAAASVLAKVTRDRIMRAEARHFPGYDFDLNKGYPCPRHKAALAAWGPTSIHRRTWVFMDHLPWGGVPRFVRTDP